MEHFADLGLGQGDGKGGVVPAFVESREGIEHGGAGQLDFPEEIGGAVLQALEAADDLAELLALFQIGDGLVEGRLGASEHFRGQGRPAPVEDGVQQIGVAEALAGIHRGIDGEAGVGPVVREFLCGGGDAGLPGHEVKAQAVPIPRGAAFPSYHDDLLSAAAVDDEALLPLQLHGIGARRGREGGAVGLVVGALFEGEGEADLAFYHFGQQRISEGAIAAQGQSAGAQHHGAQQRRGGQVAPRLLEDRAHGLPAEVGPADGFRQGDAGPAELHHGLPRVEVVARGARVLPEGSEGRHGGLAGAELCGGGLDKGLIFVQYERHSVFSLPWVSAAPSLAPDLAPASPPG